MNTNSLYTYEHITFIHMNTYVFIPCNILQAQNLNDHICYLGLAICLLMCMAAYLSVQLFYQIRIITVILVSDTILMVSIVYSKFHIHKV